MPSPGLISSAWKHGYAFSFGYYGAASRGYVVRGVFFAAHHILLTFYAIFLDLTLCCLLHAQAGDDATGLPALPRA